MNRILLTTSALAVCATAGFAAGVERSAGAVTILFEEGNWAEFSLGYVDPDISGSQAIAAGPTSPAGAESGDIAPSYLQVGAGVKWVLSEQIEGALIVDQPIGADVLYGADTGYLYGGSSALFGGSVATIDSIGITGLLKYNLPNNVSVYGGLKAVRTEGNVGLFNGYSMSTSSETDLGYIVGAAWEKPEIAARVSLTYSSAITHDFESSEVTSLGVLDSGFSSTIPQSVTLEGQTGVAADTLVFGSIRWVDWSEFDITPPGFASGSGGASLVSYENDAITYTLGVGRRFSEEWSGAVLASYEAAQGGFSGNLGPTDGSTSLGVAVTRAIDNYEITLGARYIWIGDAETEAPSALGAPAGTTFGQFDDNSGIAVGLKVGYQF